MGRFRALVSTEDGLRVRSRRGWNMTELLPELRGLPAGVVLDVTVESAHSEAIMRYDASPDSLVRVPPPRKQTPSRASTHQMGTPAYSNYVITSGRRAIATRSAASAREAVLDYVRSLGCKRDEIVSYGADTVAWRGAVYRAEPEDPEIRSF